MWSSTRDQLSMSASRSFSIVPVSTGRDSRRSTARPVLRCGLPRGVVGRPQGPVGLGEGVCGCVARGGHLRQGARALVQGDDSEEVEQHDPLAGRHGDSFPLWRRTCSDGIVGGGRVASRLRAGSRAITMPAAPATPSVVAGLITALVGPAPTSAAMTPPTENAAWKADMTGRL